MSITFSKIVGTGNDFLFVDARAEISLPASRESLAKRVCDRHFGVGADGLVFVENGRDGAELRWDFYNNDGSHAEMCGNASRCMGRWAQLKLGLSKVTFDTAAGRVQTRVDGSDIAADIRYLKIQFEELEFDLHGTRKKATFVNTGVPHAVFEVPDIRLAADARDEIKALRFHPGVGARGTNVTFLQMEGADRFSTVTFERGVEDFTLSCGTGVMAAAAVGIRKRANATEGGTAKLSTPGGLLEVSYGQNWSGAVLKGPAKFLFDLALSEEFLR